MRLDSEQGLKHKCVGSLAAQTNEPLPRLKQKWMQKRSVPIPFPWAVVALSQSPSDPQESLWLRSSILKGTH